MGDFPPDDPDDVDDPDESVDDASIEGDLSALDALGTYEDIVFSEDGDGGVAPSVDDTEDSLGIPLFEVTNPPETVTVTVFLDGRVQRIDLAPKCVQLTERDLAEEILLIAGLAADRARSAQYSSLLAGMREYGHDDAATRDFLHRDLNLLTPEQADDARAQVFSTRYGGDHG